MRKQFFKAFTVASSSVKVASFEYILCHSIIRKIYKLHIVRNKRGSLYSVPLSIEKYVVTLISCGRVYLYKMISERADYYIGGCAAFALQC